MILPDNIYAFDCETDNSQGNGLNPLKAGITDIALATADGDKVFTRPQERDLLAAFANAVTRLPTGILGSWGGTHFDVPYLRTRAAAASYVLHGFTFTPVPGLPPKYQLLPGSDSGYTFTAISQHNHGQILHLDVAYACKQHAERLGVPWQLKPFARALGLDVVELDRTRLHTYTQEERDAYVASDARVARQIILWLFGYPTSLAGPANGEHR